MLLLGDSGLLRFRFRFRLVSGWAGMTVHQFFELLEVADTWSDLGFDRILGFCHNLLVANSGYFFRYFLGSSSGNALGCLVHSGLFDLVVLGWLRTDCKDPCSRSSSDIRCSESFSSLLGGSDSEHALS